MCATVKASFGPPYSHDRAKKCTILYKMAADGAEDDNDVIISQWSRTQPLHGAPCTSVVSDYRAAARVIDTN